MYTLGFARPPIQQDKGRCIMTTATTECLHPNWEHEYDEDSILGDAYYCADCDELMQVG